MRNCVASSHIVQTCHGNHRADPQPARDILIDGLNDVWPHLAHKPIVLAAFVRDAAAGRKCSTFFYVYSPRDHTYLPWIQGMVENSHNQQEMSR